MPGDVVRLLALYLILTPSVGSCKSPNATPSANDDETLSKVQHLYESLDWHGVLHTIASSPIRSPELHYYQGMALARLERWEEAKRSFETGGKAAPRDKRFLQEIAGVSFKLQQYGEAKTALEKALKLERQDQYTLEFLASIFWLEGNLEGALKYWNQIDKPGIEEVKRVPKPRLRPEILDRAFAFSPAGQLTLEDFRTTRARLERLEIYPRCHFELQPKPDQKFDLLFHPLEKNGWGENRLEKAFSIFQNIPSLSIRLDLYNLRQSAANSESQFRFDSQKLRAFTQFSAPLGGNPSWRYRFYLGGRKENWNLTRSFQAEFPLPGDLRLQHLSAGLEVGQQINWRWTWKSGMEITYRDFLNPPLVPKKSEHLFTSGTSIKYKSMVERYLLRIPERRITARSFATFETGKLFGSSLDGFSKFQGGAKMEWFPRSKGEDFAVHSQFRAGAAGGGLPFDELFILGLESDNDLWLRAHVATRDRKRGSGFLGTNYLLFNSEFDKRIYQHALLDLYLGPSLDTGKIYDPEKIFGSKAWLWDLGILLKVHIRLGPKVIFSYGKDLQTGRNGFYVTTTR